MGFKLLGDIVLVAKSENGSDVPKPIKSEDMKLKGLPDRSSPEWHAFGAIFWREWFTRIWIIQETSVADFVVVTCGTDLCSWSGMCIAAKYILDHSFDAITGVDPKQVIMVSSFSGRNDSNRGLLRLLSEARGSFATDDRDKIYAILGLASDVDDLSLLPDYT